MSFQETEDLLIDKPVGSYLMRFSESSPGAAVIAFKSIIEESGQEKDVVSNKLEHSKTLKTTFAVFFFFEGPKVK